MARRMTGIFGYAIALFLRRMNYINSEEVNTCRVIPVRLFVK